MMVLDVLQLVDPIATLNSFHNIVVHKKFTDENNNEMNYHKQISIEIILQGLEIV